MNKINLIKLGAIAQNKFNMKEGFEIREYPSDSDNVITIQKIKNIGKIVISDPSIISDIESDTINLMKFGSYDEFEFIWAGYSENLNILVIRESRE